MSILSELKELHFVLKYVIANLCLTVPFFYIDLYFLKHNLFLREPFYIPIVLSVCMSICWYYSITFISVIGEMMSPQEINKNKNNDIEDFHFLSSILTVTTIAIISTICIYLSVSFKTFFHVCLAVNILFLILVIGFNYLRKKLHH